MSQPPPVSLLPPPPPAIRLRRNLGEPSPQSTMPVGNPTFGKGVSNVENPKGGRRYRRRISRRVKSNSLKRTRRVQKKRRRSTRKRSRK